MNHSDVSEAIKSGIKYLSRTQKEDGSFSNFISVSKRFENPKENRSIFPACLILASLDSLPQSKVLGKVKSKSAKFLLSQKSDFWSWNYWKRNSPESKDAPYPDDLDDTCCAMVALIKHDPKSISIKAVSKVVNLLTFCESKEGGPYYSWLTPPDADKGWKDIDLAVNSNIAFFLSLQEVTLKSLIALTEKAIDSGEYASPYYHSQYSVIYFISRWYKGKKKDKIISYLLKKRLENDSWGNPLETALAVSALINFGYEKEKLEKSIGYILKNQIEGEWRACPLIIELVKNKQKHYSGSAELTTAFCLEALGKFSAKDKLIENKRKAGIDDKPKKIHRKIINFTDRRFSNFNPELNEKFLAVRKKILKGDRANQITLLPYYFQKSLKNNKAVNENILVELGAASLYGWMAYTIYDDFFDGEGNRELLSLANICLRELTSIYGDNFAKNEKFLQFFKNTMDRIDSANAWETSNCRAKISGSHVTIPNQLPDFGKLERLADRSIGHALGPVAVLYLRIGNVESSEIKKLMAFFENYIIARQLNDDAHDWEDDLKKGQLSPTVVAVLKKHSRRRGNKSTKELDLKKEIKELQKIFWYEVIQEMCDKTLFHVKKARKHLLDITVMENKTAFEGMLASVENSAKEALAEQKEMLEFLEEYR
ncbi:MAG TPA: terpene cyclase/mutase family protein [Candidatus Moranbacteria bacterium]|nr:terpene cyclase/mutase family protein [Candidatus Moranbacteria bacterium]